MEILLTRHGQTEWNVLGKVQGRADIELNERGIEQAEETGKVLKSEQIDLIICSPLKRAKQTAEIINKDRNISIIYDEDVIERDFGEFEGINKKEFDFEGYWSYKQNSKYEKAENIKDFFDRVYNFLDKIKEKYKDKRILIVAHGGISIPVNCYFNGIPEDDNLLNLILGNCEVVKYQYKD
ncbi:MAG: histidine phosphatase family protein [Clostridia bacterium]|nr:histidine phosphatase family protein [Clostridia bacterium]